MTTSLDAIRQWLGTLPAGLHSLGTDEQQQLLASLQQAEKAERAELREALEKSLSHIPLLLRGTVRKILLP